MDTIVHVVGTGTIGEPLLGLLAKFRQQLGISEVSFHKRTPLRTDRSKVMDLLSKGVRLAVDANQYSKFTAMGMMPSLEAEEAIDRAAVVIDCTPAGNENKASIYSRFTGSTKGFIAQGSETGFGKPYARGINDAALIPGEDQFLQVVSCNTHNLAVMLSTIGHNGGSEVDNLCQGRFLCIRRSNDISQVSNFVPSPVVGKHNNERFGTHHAADAHRLYGTLRIDMDVYSSALKLNSQYMHILQFNIRVKNPTSVADIIKVLKANDRIATTYKMSANEVFSFGRDHGFHGRILSQTVIPIPTLAVNNGHEVVGFCFTPQDGNSLLSSVAAACWYLDPDTYEERIQCLKPYLFAEV